MPFVPVTNVAHAQFVGQIDGQETVNDLYFVSTAPPITALSLSVLADALSLWYTTDLVPVFAEDWEYSHTRVRDLTAVDSFVATSTNGGPVSGGTTGEAAPSNVTANITFGTGLAGRNNHGSNRLPAIPNEQITLNTLDTGFLTTIVNTYSDLIAPSTVLPGGWTWVVVSRFSGFTIVDGKKVPTPRDPAVFHEIFDVYFTDAIVDSQKTRLPKHGK